MLNGAVTRVAVEGDSGNVVLRSGPAGRATVGEKQRYWLHHPKLRLRLRDGVLAVKVDCGGFSPGCSDDLVITAPPGVGRASVAVDSGDVSLRALDTRELEAFSDSRDIDAEDVGGEVHLQTDSADVKARGLRGDTVAAGTDSGDVDVALLTAPRSLSARTDSGDVHLDGVLRDDLSAHRIDARTDSGDITVRGR